MIKKKILIVGGTGIAGQSIIDYLLRYNDLCELFVASRGNKLSSNKTINYIKLDIHQSENLLTTLKQYDIVVLALGPFSEVGTDIYEQCLHNNIICVDINDDYNQCDKIIKIGQNDRKKCNGMVLTGMGLCPGLTSFMLQLGAEQLNGNAEHAQLRIFFGAGVSSGRASIINMFEGFKNDVKILKHGKIQDMPSCNIGLDKSYSFDDSHSNRPLVYFSSPELITLSRSDRFTTLRNFDSAFHLQNLPMYLVPLLKRSAYFRRLTCKMVGKQQNKLKQSAKNEKSVIVCTTVANKTSKVDCFLSSDSSYRLTGIFCASIIVMLMRENIQITPGVFTFEDLNVDSDILNKVLANNNIRIQINK